jgi:diguanylate cyclase (GGDEF)-like protein
MFMDNLILQALNKVQSGIIIVDKELNILFWNHWLEHFSGKKWDEVSGKNVTDVCPRFKVKSYLDILQKTLYHGQSRFCSSTLHKAFILPKDVQDENSNKQNMNIEPLYEGDSCYALIQISEMTNMYNRVFKLKNLIRDMEAEFNEIKTSEKHSRYLALHDPLTELPNRLFFNDRLAWAISYAERNGDMLAVMFLDLDGFKAVNDAFGHAIGDRILIETAKRLRGCIRDSDTIARLGGDEFIVVVSQIKDEADVSIIARKFIEVLRDPFEINGNPINLSISVGISLYPKDADEPSDLLKKADMAMYRIKETGKNAYGFVE